VDTVTAKRIFSVSSEEFEPLALDIFRFQARECRVYSEFIYHLGVNPEKVARIEEVPFLPIEFFKTHQVTASEDPPEIIFTSSGTTGTSQSRHLVTQLSLYEQSFRKGFETFYGSIADYTVLALLPSYLEREGSSLIYMADAFIHESANNKSGYFLFNHDELYTTLMNLKDQKKRTLLIGVTYALLDFAETYKLNFPELIVMETGGMKGRRKEMTREELHEILCRGFGVSSIHSEYGMTELLSQAYSKENGRFQCPPWMKVLIRDINDPFFIMETGRSGGLNIIDLANVNSCSFIASQDLGKLHSDGYFEVLGRFDNSDIRGCNLLVQ